MVLLSLQVTTIRDILSVGCQTVIQSRVQLPGNLCTLTKSWGVQAEKQPAPVPFEGGGTRSAMCQIDLDEGLIPPWQGSESSSEDTSPFLGQLQPRVKPGSVLLQI